MWVAKHLKEIMRISCIQLGSMFFHQGPKWESKGTGTGTQPDPSGNLQPMEKRLQGFLRIRSIHSGTKFPPPGLGRRPEKLAKGPQWKCEVGGETFAGNLQIFVLPIRDHVFPSGAGMGCKAIDTKAKLPKRALQEQNQYNPQTFAELCPWIQELISPRRVQDRMRENYTTAKGTNVKRARKPLQEFLRIC